MDKYPHWSWSWGAITRHQESKQSRATSTLFLIKMIAKLEWTQWNAQQNIEQLHNPTMRAAINNNRTTALERTAFKATRRLNEFYGYKIFAIEFAVVEANKKTVKLAWRLPNYCTVSSQLGRKYRELEEMEARQKKLREQPKSGIIPVAQK